MTRLGWQILLNSFLGKKEICREILKHEAVSYIIGNLTLRFAERLGWLLIRLSGFPLIPKRRLRDRLVFRNLPKQGKILDVGCSFGVYSFPLAMKGYSVVGCDLNEESIMLAKKIKGILKLRNVSFFLNDIFDCDFSLEKFDAIIALEVLEHIKEDTRAIVHLRKFLKDGGLLLVSVPFVKVMEEYEEAIPVTRSRDGKLVRIGKGGAHYRNGYNIPGLTELLERNGFSVVDLYYSCLPDGFLNASGARAMFMFPFTYPVALLLNKLSNKKRYITCVAIKN